jgi:hypothetical protein
MSCIDQNVPLTWLVKDSDQDDLSCLDVGISSLALPWEL